MIAIKAIYENGQIILNDLPLISGPVEVLVVFPEPTNDPWDAILTDPASRPALAKMVEEVQDEISRGNVKPLRFQDS
jgi:hypothetical protein